LATDDAWGDRVLDISAADLDAFVAPGPGFAVVPGTAFEYSNLGFAMLGRVVANVTGGSCQDAITDRFLQPLGLLDTVWAPRPDQADVAVGHRRVEGEWELEDQPMGDGGIAPMGGLWSTVADMARWVSFFLDAFPPRDGTDGGPLCRASRREMQRVWRPERLRVEQLDLHGRLRAGPAGYGCGLFVIDDLTMGLAVAHSGGLPGYGSNMRWMPHRGIGVVSLANVTYAPMASTNRSCFEALHAGGFLPPARTLEPPPPLRQAASDLVELLGRWSQDRAGSLFADNVVLDDALHRRAEAAAQLVETIGQIGVREVRALSRGSADVVVQGERGAALVELSLHPGAAPMVQWYDLTVIVAPAAELLRANEALCALVRTDVTASDLDGLVDDELAEVVAADLARLAGRVGPCRPASVPGDEGRTTFRWHGHGDVDVDVAIDWHAERARVSSFGLQLPTLGDV
jgi:CubicO group peptidase (beta-lactamase class C family)